MIPQDRYSEEHVFESAVAAAKAIGVNRRTIAAWIRRGYVHAERRPTRRGRYYIAWKDLYAYYRPVPANPSSE